MFELINLCWPAMCVLIVAAAAWLFILVLSEISAAVIETLDDFGIVVNCSGILDALRKTSHLRKEKRA